MSLHATSARRHRSLAWILAAGALIVLCTSGATLIQALYGVAAGNKLTSLLRTHIMEAVPILAAAGRATRPSSVRRSEPGMRMHTRSQPS